MSRNFRNYPAAPLLNDDNSDDNELDDPHASYSSASIGPRPRTLESPVLNNSTQPSASFLRHVSPSAAIPAAGLTTNASPIPAANMANDPPPLMPLFTPVLQDFQSRFGSAILPPQERDSHDDDDDITSPPPFHEQAAHHLDDEDDEPEDPSKSLLFNVPTSRRRENDGPVGFKPKSFFAGKNPPAGGGGQQRSSSPFVFDHRQGGFRGGLPPPVSSLRQNFEHGTDHEAPASLMIEMGRNSNRHDLYQEDDDEDDSRGGLWGLGEMARKSRKRLGYKRPGMNAAELAMWKWVNVENLDNFLAKVYEYYVGKGMYTIILERCLNLLTFAFVIGFATFLIGCVDYPRLRHSKHLNEVLIPQCMHRLPTGTFVVLLLFAAFWVGQLIRLFYDIPQLVDMCNFYTYLLQIPDEDIQTVSWSEVSLRIVQIRDNNPNTTTAATIQTTDTQRLNAHDIANRIMRKENYMIALFNKELLDLSIPLPLLRSRTILTRILEWSLGFCILGYVFDDRGQVRKRFLKDTRRTELVEGLRRRFQFMGFATLVFSPLISIYLILYFFFRYFEEYHKNPGSIGTRQYTPIAKWKFKEFNELPHLFDERIDASYPLAMKYIGQFPKEKTILICRFVAFISGSFAAVLALMTLFDQELLLGLEITSEKTVFFYLGVFGTIMAVSRGMIPNQTEKFDPVLLLEDVVKLTHYMPSEWQDKLHTDEVRKQFALLFEYNVMLYALEFMSLVLTPLILWLSLPNCSEKVIDFFREFTVHVDGVGYVCSFAVFDFRRHGDVKYGAPVTEVTDERFVSNQGKMEKSFLNFKQNNPEWEPNDPTGSMYISKLLDADSVTNPMHRYQTDHRSSNHRSRPESMQPPMPWINNPAYARPIGDGSGGADGGFASSSIFHPSNQQGGLLYRQSTQAKTRQGLDMHPEESDEGDLDDLQAVRRNTESSPGVKFYLGSRHQQGSRGPGISGSGPDDYSSGGEMGGRPNLAGFVSNMGDSFMANMDHHRSRQRKDKGRYVDHDREPGDHQRQGASQGKGRSSQSDVAEEGYDDGGANDSRRDEMVDSFENERDSQKKGVFGLLNQIYEMNNVHM
ncbi:autophagy protein atg9 [Lunasporangiospora selenospora]|uniref:Autophagy-related protein 9 n=1 Tax=Lunasporangiospora selenospora TaxID=979761 RepID=A0A9P6KD94_9FUNG|nr:autophagy protein atg9 [Lunasporangiospora selenospora]